jgi:membrane associated rhomboid family serine protease
MHDPLPPSRHEPIFNLPAAVLGLAAVLFLIHVARQWIGQDADLDLLVRFAFIPVRYLETPQVHELFGSPDAGRWWSPVTYGLLHGGWDHLIVNTLWLVVFGSAVAWRFGTARFLLFTAVTTAAGAGVHLLGHWGEAIPMVGASAGISGLTAAAARFVFEAGGPLGGFGARGPHVFMMPATPLLESLRNTRVLAFVGLWFAITLLFGIGGAPLAGGGDATIAWEAHLGGFLAGLALFPLFDPVSSRSPAPR